MKDCTGNRAPVFVCNGATGHADHTRAEHDYYATEPRATELLLGLEKFAPRIWEPACGAGHMANVLASNGYEVKATDLIDRGFGTGGVDFLVQTEKWDGDIITNPPYKFAAEFVEKAFELVADGAKVAMFLKLTFLEGKTRRAMFNSTPPLRVWVSSSRLQCGINGDFGGTSATAYAWFVWQKGHKGDSILKWFN